ncbi:hypothetical protein QBC47DRAFT_397499 [Echria macrotheca]|uniref:Uncharacterized protein n=1 Tax=Echria macrotheca TaxID=438768 RepID=A0AAJ0FBW8_9PEZI|nr:hypothetical protein QBC47DRAFT_397499 [Echria macrotheca]
MKSISLSRITIGALILATGQCTSSDLAEEIPYVPVPDDYTGRDPAFKTQIVSTSPLVLYLTGFLSRHEVNHLKAQRDVLFPFLDGSGHPLDAQRLSRNEQDQDTENAPQVDRDTDEPDPLKATTQVRLEKDEVTRCIQSRLASLQGHNPPVSHIDRARLSHFRPGQTYPYQADWLSSRPSVRDGEQARESLAASGGDRIFSLVAWAHVPENTTGGGMNFPLLAPPRDDAWCDVVECDEPWENGLTFRPIEGNAVFWMNPEASGNGGNRALLRATAPLTGGEVVALEIVTRQAPVYD